MGVAGIDGRAGLRSAPPHEVEAALEVIGGLDVDRDPVRSGVEVLLQAGLRPLDHQVHVERQPSRFAQGADDRRAEGQVRHEMAVHHVHVDEVRAPGLGHRQGVGEAREVGREQGRRDPDFHERGAARASGDRETVSETTSRLDRG